jgi:hypothetical protein
MPLANYRVRQRAAGWAKRSVPTIFRQAPWCGGHAKSAFAYTCFAANKKPCRACYGQAGLPFPVLRLDGFQTLIRLLIGGAGRRRRLVSPRQRRLDSPDCGCSRR